ncbi:hypothetical protein GCM10028864_43180 [Microlunatus parietis]
MLDLREEHLDLGVDGVINFDRDPGTAESGDHPGRFGQTHVLASPRRSAASPATAGDVHRRATLPEHSRDTAAGTTIRASHNGYETPEIRCRPSIRPAHCTW